MTTLPGCFICKRPARCRLMGFPLCRRCYTATTSKINLCFECLIPLARNEEIYCAACEPGE